MNASTDTVTVTVVQSGVTTMSSMNNVRVYPNPITDGLHITGILQNTNYLILNVTGECVAHESLCAGSSVISTQNYRLTCISLS